MNKEEFIKVLATKADISNAKADDLLNMFFDTITGALSKGDTIRFVGFGTFGVKSRAASKARNPRTGEEIKVPARKVAYFKAGKGLKDAVNN